MEDLTIFCDHQLTKKWSKKNTINDIIKWSAGFKENSTYSRNHWFETKSAWNLNIKFGGHEIQRIFKKNWWCSYKPQDDERITL